jgi:hypothetical protein
MFGAVLTYNHLWKMMVAMKGIEELGDGDISKSTHSELRGPSLLSFC